MMTHKGEINLMPQPLQVQRQRGLYLARTRQLVLTLLLALLLAAGGGGGVWWWLQLQLQETADDTAAELAASEPAARVTQLNELLHQFEQRRDEIITWTPLLADVFTAVPEGVRITSLKGSVEDGSLTVGGVADERAAIITFQQSLEHVAWVRALDAPLSNLTIGGMNSFTFVLRMPEDV